jgi:streptogramin lyase
VEAGTAACQPTPVNVCGQRTSDAVGGSPELACPAAGDCTIGGITAGPDGALWFSNTSKKSIGRITATVPSGTATGPTTVTTPADTAVSHTSFTVT